MTRALVDQPVLTVIFEDADPEFDNPVAIGVGACGFHIQDGCGEFWTVVGWVIFGLRLQSTGDAIMAALDERSGRVFRVSLPCGG